MADHEQKRTEVATRAYSEQAKLRRTGMFIDLAGFILQWRMANPPRWYPSEPEMRDYLISRGWKTKPSRKKLEGGEVTIRTIQEMMATITSGEDVFPPASLDRIASNYAEALPDTEIATVAIEPQAWADYCEEVRDGWSPSWRAETLNEDDAEKQLRRLNDLLSR